MDIKQLHYFVTIVDEGNISNAAKKLHMSQPPLSTQIKLLEEELGCVLFERGSRRIVLTVAGDLLYNRAKTLLEMVSLTKTELIDHQNGAKGTLRLGVISSAGSTILNHWIQSFHEKYPNICFDIYEANTYQLLEQLRSNIIEVAIVRTPFVADDFQYTYLTKEPMLAVGHETFFENCTSDEITLAELSKKPLIIYHRWESVLNGIFHEDNLSATIFCKNDDARTTALWADSGLGVGVIPASCKSLLKNTETTIKKISDRRLDSSISIIHHKNTYMTTIARLFIDYVKNQSDLSLLK